MWYKFISVNLILLRALASHGADLNLSDGKGQTPLLMALSKNQQQSFIALLEGIKGNSDLPLLSYSDVNV